LSEAVLESRVAALEHAVDELQAWRSAGGPVADWIDRLTGSISDESVFEEALEAGRAIRSADRPAEQG
jgi:hypothetical protein